MNKIFPDCLLFRKEISKPETVLLIPVMDAFCPSYSMPVIRIEHELELLALILKL